MSSTTGEHINELEARRKKREAREGAANGDKKPRRISVAADVTRDLWHDLIAKGPPAGPDATAPPDANAPDTPRTDDENVTSVPEQSVEPQRAARRKGEGVDELVRRVQAGAQTGAEEAARASRQHRPTGTADLSADAATRHRTQRRASRRPVEVAPRPVESKRRVRWAAAAAVVLLAGVVAVASLDSAGGRHVATTHASTSSSAFDVTSMAGFGGVLRTTIAAVDRELRGLAHRTAASVKPVRRVMKYPRVRARRNPARTTHATSAAQNQSVNVSLPTTSSPTSTYTPSPSASSTQSSGTGASSSSSHSPPAGPTNAGPLGGIGACVKGC